MKSPINAQTIERATDTPAFFIFIVPPALVAVVMALSLYFDQSSGWF